MSDSLYEEDFFAWTQTQARALKAYRADGGLDYGNLADEVGGLGRAQRATVISMVRQILVHLYKLAATGRDAPKRHWLIEIGNFRAELDQEMTPTLRHRLERGLERQHRQAARFAQESMDVYEPGTKIDGTLRWSMDQITGDSDDPLDRFRPETTD